MGFGHRSRSPAQTTNERTYDVLPNPDIFQSYRQNLICQYAISSHRWMGTIPVVFSATHIDTEGLT